LYCWGDNSEGQVGDGTVGEQRPAPKKIGTNGVWATVSAGGFHTCAISTGKSLYCWGSNFAGQIGDGTGEQRPSPKKIGTSGAWAGPAPITPAQSRPRARCTAGVTTTVARSVTGRLIRASRR
jgi:hypothetical protein